jgi:Co/Zn/Cd efflux system component
MMADCAAMYVDVVTYLFNCLAERLKQGHCNMSARELRLRRLWVELIPPLISVVTLVVVTILSLREAWNTLEASTHNNALNDQPDVNIMLTFSALNMVLDIVNVGCFARVDPSAGQSDECSVASSDLTETLTEGSPLLSSSSLSRDMESEVPMLEWESDGTMNLNMCSAWTHVFADTLRSITVLIAAGIAFLFPLWLSPTEADSWGAIVVSFIILASTLPLLQGLYSTACKIRSVWLDQSTSTSSQVAMKLIV